MELSTGGGALGAPGEPAAPNPPGGAALSVRLSPSTRGTPSWAAGPPALPADPEPDHGPHPNTESSFGFSASPLAAATGGARAGGGFRLFSFRPFSSPRGAMATAFLAGTGCGGWAAAAGGGVAAGAFSGAAALGAPSCGARSYQKRARTAASTARSPMRRLVVFIVYCRRHATPIPARHQTGGLDCVVKKCA